MENQYPNFIEIFSESQQSIHRYVKSLGNFIDTIDKIDYKNENVKIHVKELSKKMFENLADIQRYQLKKLQIFYKQDLTKNDYDYYHFPMQIFLNYAHNKEENKSKNMIYFYKKYSYSPIPYIYIRNSDPTPPWKSLNIT